MGGAQPSQGLFTLPRNCELLARMLPSPSSSETRCERAFCPRWYLWVLMPHISLVYSLHSWPRNISDLWLLWFHLLFSHADFPLWHSLSGSLLHPRCIPENSPYQQLLSWVHISFSSIFFQVHRSITSTFFKWALKVPWALSQFLFSSCFSCSHTYLTLHRIHSWCFQCFLPFLSLFPSIPLSTIPKPLQSIWSYSIASHEVVLTCPSSRSDLLILSLCHHIYIWYKSLCTYNLVKLGEFLVRIPLSNSFL